MQAIVQHAYGTVDDVLLLQDIDEPTPGPHEVLVRVHAASVNHGDWFVTSGRPYVIRAALGLGRPRVAVRGRDLAGRVEAVGEAVTRFHPGDDVYAETITGSFAEYACVPERLLAREADQPHLRAGRRRAGRRRHRRCRASARSARSQPGHAVLINGASGGVGTFAVQIAKALGADVTGVWSTTAEPSPIRAQPLVQSLSSGPRGRVRR